MLKPEFVNLMRQFSGDSAHIETLWDELVRLYAEKSRHYHTMAHLEHLWRQLIDIQGQIQDWDAVLLALFYHDSVYNVLKKDNEVQSALLAEKRLQTLGAPTTTIDKTTALILATQTHQVDADADVNLFTDADLSVLGQAWPVYLKYCQDVRKEYAVYPNLLYNPGRRKVLRHFLSMERIFKTDHFADRFEAQARQNLQREQNEIL